jgi:hypothetical protein
MGFDIEGYERLILDFESMMIRHSAVADIRLDADKWTLKEMVGHLIDSASNNHQRFVRLQLSGRLSFPGYDAEEWIKISAAASLDYKVLVALWKNYNLFLLHLIHHMDEDALDHYWEINNEQKSLKFLVEDYYAHLEWHLALFDERIRELGQ